MCVHCIFSESNRFDAVVICLYIRSNIVRHASSVEMFQILIFFFPLSRNYSFILFLHVLYVCDYVLKCRRFADTRGNNSGGSGGRGRNPISWRPGKEATGNRLRNEIVFSRRCERRKKRVHVFVPLSSWQQNTIIIIYRGEV